MTEPIILNCLLKHPANYLLCAPSSGGKTTWMRRLVNNRHIMMTTPTPKNVLLVYEESQPIYDEMVAQGVVSTAYKGMPDLETLKAALTPHVNDGGSVLVVDDQMSNVTDDFIKIFTVLSHHYKCSVLFLTQSLYLQNKTYRVISQNAHYIVLLRNRRDASVVSSLARQVSPYNTRYIVDAFLNATKKPYSYLLFDLHSASEDILRLRTNIFPEESPMVVFMDNKL